MQCGRHRQALRWLALVLLLTVNSYVHKHTGFQSLYRQPSSAFELNVKTNINVEQSSRSRQEHLSSSTTWRKGHKDKPASRGGGSQDNVIDANAIDRRIVETFKIVRPGENFRSLQRFLEQNRGALTHNNLLTFLGKSNRYRLDVFDFFPSESMARWLDISSTSMSYQSILHASEALIWTSKHRVVERMTLMRVISEQLMHNTYTLDFPQIAELMYNLRGLNSDMGGVREYLRAICLVINRQFQATESDTFNMKFYHGSKKDVLKAMNIRTASVATAFKGMLGLSNKLREVRYLQSFLGASLKHMPSRESMNTHSFTSIINGLKSSTDQAPECRAILVILSRLLQEDPCILSDMSVKQLSKSLWGMQGLSSNTPEVALFLRVFCDAIEHASALNTRDAVDHLPYSSSIDETIVCAEPQEGLGLKFGLGGEIGPALGGLRRMSSKHFEVRRLLRILNRAMRKAQRRVDHDTGAESVVNEPIIWVNVNEGHIGNMLYGMQGMSTEHSEVLAVLECVQANIQQIPFTLKGKTMANVLYGLQGMTLHSATAQRLLGSIHRKMDLRSSDYTGSHIAMMCYGLQSIGKRVIDSGARYDIVGNGGMWDTPNGVADALIADIAMCVSRSEHRMSAQNIGMAMFGLQNMGADNAAVCSLLDTLADKLDVILQDIVDFRHDLVDESQYDDDGDGDTDDEDDESESGDRDVSDRDRTYGHSGSHFRGRQKPHSHSVGRGPSNGKKWRRRGERGTPAMAGWDGKCIAMMMQGLQHMGSEWVEVQRMVELIATALDHTNVQLSASELSIIIYSMQTMGGSSHTLPPPKPRYIVDHSDSEGDTAIGNAGKRKTKEEPPGQYHGEARKPGARAVHLASSDGQSNNAEVLIVSNDTDNHGAYQSDRPIDFSSVHENVRKRYKLPRALNYLLHSLYDQYIHRPQCLSPKEISIALYGLQGISSDPSVVRRLITQMSDDLNACNKAVRRKLKQRGFKLSKGFPTESLVTHREPVDDMVSTVKGAHQRVLFSRKIPLPPPPMALVLDSQGMSNALYGLQNMTIRNSAHIPHIIDSLATALQLSPYSLTAQGVGNSFYGLQYMSSESKEVRRLLKSLSRKVENMPLANRNYANDSDRAADRLADRFLRADFGSGGSIRAQSGLQPYMLTGQNIGNALWGLRNMTSDCQEVRDCIRAITLKVNESDYELNGQNFGNAFYALHAKTNGVEDEEVRELLAVLAQKLVKTNAQFSALDIGMILYGLKTMDASTAEVRVILGTVLYKIRHSDSSFELRDLFRAIVGTLASSPWIRDDFLRVLATKTDGMNYEKS